MSISREQKSLLVGYAVITVAVAISVAAILYKNSKLDTQRAERLAYFAAIRDEACNDRQEIKAYTDAVLGQKQGPTRRAETLLQTSQRTLENFETMDRTVTVLDEVEQHERQRLWMETMDCSNASLGYVVSYWEYLSIMSNTLGAN